MIFSVPLPFYSFFNLRYPSIHIPWIRISVKLISSVFPLFSLTKDSFPYLLQKSFANFFHSDTLLKSNLAFFNFSYLQYHLFFFYYLLIPLIFLVVYCHHFKTLFLKLKSIHKNNSTLVLQWLPNYKHTKYDLNFFHITTWIRLLHLSNRYPHNVLPKMLYFSAAFFN